MTSDCYRSPTSQDVDVEQPLSGGAQSRGIVRVGATVRRPRQDGAELRQALLRHLEAVGFSGAPRALCYDDQGREVVSFVEGQVFHAAPYLLSDAKLLSATELIRGYHDATASSPFRDDQEVLCHGDLGPHNTVFRGDTAIAIIDWDADLAPGRRIVDFAHAVWCFADLIEASVPLYEQGRRAQLMCAAYPGMTPSAVVTELRARFTRARHHHRAADRPAAFEVFEGLIAWLDTNGERIAGLDDTYPRDRVPAPYASPDTNRAADGPDRPRQ